MGIESWTQAQITTSRPSHQTIMFEARNSLKVVYVTRYKNIQRWGYWAYSWSCCIIVWISSLIHKSILGCWPSAFVTSLVCRFGDRRSMDQPRIMMDRRGQDGRDQRFSPRGRGAWFGAGNKDMGPGYVYTPHLTQVWEKCSLKMDILSLSQRSPLICGVNFLHLWPFFYSLFLSVLE